ncbi:unnamed protein product, partial [Choristocarpus tenellus]
TWKDLTAWFLGEDKKFVPLARALRELMSEEICESATDMQVQTFLESLKKDLNKEHTRQVYNSILAAIAPDVRVLVDGVTSTYQPSLSKTPKKYIKIDTLISSATK